MTLNTADTAAGLAIHKYHLQVWFVSVFHDLTDCVPL